MGGNSQDLEMIVPTSSDLIKPSTILDSFSYLTALLNKELLKSMFLFVQKRGETLQRLRLHSI